MTATAESVSTETCSACGFDGSRWDRRDTLNTIRHLDDMAEHATRGATADLLNERPGVDVWSINEYLSHMGWVVRLNRQGMEVALAEPGLDVGGRPEVPELAHERFDHRELLATLTEEIETTRELLAGLADNDWTARIVVGGATVDVEWIARHIVHDVLHHLDDIARIRHDLGDSVALQGTIEQISASGGGVPKSPLDRAMVAVDGIAGDVQGTRQHHGRPWQALCLYSADVIDDLRSEGHPITAGAVGENLTLRGIDWSALRSGLIVTIGETRCRLTLPAEPCKKINGAFEGINSMRIDHERHPGWARWYASVLAGGEITRGAEVTVSSG